MTIESKEIMKMAAAHILQMKGTFVHAKYRKHSNLYTVAVLRGSFACLLIFSAEVLMLPFSLLVVARTRNMVVCVIGVGAAPGRPSSSRSMQRAAVRFSGISVSHELWCK